MVVTSLVVLVAIYAAGLLRLWRTAGAGRGIRYGEAMAFALGWLALAAALLPPLDESSETSLAAHMVQHELLMVVAAPLVALGAPVIAIVWALPMAWRRRTIGGLRHPAIAGPWSVATAPGVAWLLHAAALWIWHLPKLYDAAVASEGVHALEHLSFFSTAALFWWGMARGRYGRVGYGASVVYIFATAIHSGLLGALLTFSPRVWFAAYATPRQTGLTPLEDQQLAGLLMWVPAGLILVAGGLLFLAAWIRESDRRVRLTLPLLVCTILLHGACSQGGDRAGAQITGGDPHRGAAAIRRYGCDTCHVIPGVPGARGLVGPTLAGIGSRTYLGGQLANTSDNLQQWIRTPREIVPHTAMPDTGVTASDGRDIAAYLYTLQ